MTSAWHMPISLIGGAFALDLIVGDPIWLPHPVRVIGKAIEIGEHYLWSGIPQQDLRRGAILVAAIITSAAGWAWLLIDLAQHAGPGFGAAVALIVAWTTLALRGLDAAAATVQEALERDDLLAARKALPGLVGRDPDSLDREGITLAVIESVAENSSDGVIAPLFFLFIGGPVAALIYKAINTMDSMVGYTDERYLHFGRCAARLDDLANLIPARLSALCLAAAAAMLRNRGLQTLAVCRTDARRHHSPNAGFPEAAMAGALGIQLGGTAVYNGKLEVRPLLGIAERPVNVTDIAAARILMWAECLIAFALMAACRWLGGWSVA